MIVLSILPLGKDGRPFFKPLPERRADNHPVILCEACVSNRMMMPMRRAAFLEVESESDSDTTQQDLRFGQVKKRPRVQDTLTPWDPATDAWLKVPAAPAPAASWPRRQWRLKDSDED